MPVVVTNLQKKLAVNSSRIKSLVIKILKKEKKTVANISIVFVNAKVIKRLNQRFLNKTHQTDVLSFDNSLNLPRKKTSWEIVICADTALLNARIFKTTPSFELKLYLVHGLLHLLGYNDNNPGNRKIMRLKEAAIMKGI